MENLHGWLFTYNSYTKTWIACLRDDYFKLFTDSKDLLKSSSIEVLQDLIIKTNGDKDKIDALLGSSSNG